VEAEESSEDEEGLELDNEEEAQFEAAQLLCELSKETIRFKKQLQVGAVIVRDEQGPLFRAEINFKSLRPQ
jgi:hypothetical protein